MAKRLVGQLPRRGVYTLIIRVEEDIRLKIGGLGIRSFPRGFYTYTGSAMGLGATSLPSRVLRHLRKDKRRRWHIDYLLAHRKVRVCGVVGTPTEERLECEINQSIKLLGRAEIPVMGFGASDCRRGCGSHLLYFGNVDITPLVYRVHAETAGVKPIIIRLTKRNSQMEGCVSI